jgi:predicted Rossmann-fold nucleotide-binding protein
LLNLLKHHRIPAFPVVLIGKEYWKPLLHWFYDSALKNKLIDERLTKLFMVTDNIDEAFDLVYDSCKKFKK